MGWRRRVVEEVVYMSFTSKCPQQVYTAGFEQMKSEHTELRKGDTKIDVDS